MKRKKFFSKNIFRSKLFLVGGVIILVFISISLVKEVLRRTEINQEIGQLEKEVGDLEERNAELADLIEYLNSTSWQEKEARTKLNLKAEGESIVITPSQNNLANSVATVLVTEPQEQISTPAKWWNYFIN